MSSYCTASDLELPAEATSDLDPAIVADAITKASGEADNYLTAHNTLPLKGTIDPALVQAVAAMATYRVMKRRGYSPMQGQNDELRRGYEDAVKWLRDISTAKAVLLQQGSDSDADAQEGLAPSSSAFVLQPPDTLGGQYSRSEDFWHDGLSTAYTGGYGPRKRGW